jgi:universal stress protein A
MKSTTTNFKKVPARPVRAQPSRRLPRVTQSPRSVHTAVKSILVPIDFSETSKVALRYAVGLAQDYDADISLIHVVEPEAYNLLSEIELSQNRITFVESATARLAKLARAEIPSFIPVHPWVQIGAPHEEIVSAARILSADLIVISTHGYTGFRHVLLGSTAERVVRYAFCPVLVVRISETLKQKG